MAIKHVKPYLPTIMKSNYSEIKKTAKAAEKLAGLTKNSSETAKTQAEN